MEFSQEQMEKAAKAKTVEELVTIAKTDGINLSNDDAKKYFSMLNTKEGEISEEELSNVAGGTCYSNGVHGPDGFKKYAIVSPLNQCKIVEINGYRNCACCPNSFQGGSTWYCSARTAEYDPYR